MNFELRKYDHPFMTLAKSTLGWKETPSELTEKPPAMDNACIYGGVQDLRASSCRKIRQVIERAVGQDSAQCQWSPCPRLTFTEECGI